MIAKIRTPKPMEQPIARPRRKAASHFSARSSASDKSPCPIIHATPRAILGNANHGYGSGADAAEGPNQHFTHDRQHLPEPIQPTHRSPRSRLPPKKYTRRPASAIRKVGFYPLRRL